MYKASPLHAGLKMVDENDKGGGGFCKNGHPPKTKISNIFLFTFITTGSVYHAANQENISSYFELWDQPSGNLLDP